MMSYISDYIARKNSAGEKVLSVFLTAGYPSKENFTELALSVLDAGADMLEIGFPFSDPLADGPVIQGSSQRALENGVTLDTVFEYVSEIRRHTDKPLILMGYANPVLAYGVKRFTERVRETGVNGVIIPDVPVEEYEDFYGGYFNGIDTIMLITPTTSEERIKRIDERSSGFVYYVSMTGTTGQQIDDLSRLAAPLAEVNKLINNKLLVGFGISRPEDAAVFAPHASGVIVGSAVIRALGSSTEGALELVSSIKGELGGQMRNAEFGIRNEI